LGKVVAHVHGGDRSQGGLDEYMRHAITKLSHLHFTATELSRKRVLALGEKPDRVFCVGSPGLDAMLHDPVPPDREIAQALGAPIPDRFILAVYHPVSTLPEQAVGEFQEMLDALRESGIHVLLSYPNTDAGSRGIAAMIDEVAREPWVTAYRNVPRLCYLALLRRCLCLVGNSSSGMIDSPAFGIPVINVGSRQQGRERGTNVVDVSPNRLEILRAIRRATTDQEFIADCRATRNPYGDGHASERIVAVLEQIEIGPELLAKEFPF
jgi:UDP-hydrolysing UDP-N-acetyl-D-glucosamine 2-epimerase